MAAAVAMVVVIVVVLALVVAAAAAVVVEVEEEEEEIVVALCSSNGPITKFDDSVSLLMSAFQCLSTIGYTVIPYLCGVSNCVHLCT